MQDHESLSEATFKEIESRLYSSGHVSPDVVALIEICEGLFEELVIAETERADLQVTADDLAHERDEWQLRADSAQETIEEIKEVLGL